MSLPLPRQAKNKFFFIFISGDVNAKWRAAPVIEDFDVRFPGEVACRSNPAFKKPTYGLGLLEHSWNPFVVGPDKMMDKVFDLQVVSSKDCSFFVSAGYHQVMSKTVNTETQIANSQSLNRLSKTNSFSVKAAVSLTSAHISASAASSHDNVKQITNAQEEKRMFFMNTVDSIDTRAILSKSNPPSADSEFEDRLRELNHTRSNESMCALIGNRPFILDDASIGSSYSEVRQI